MKKATPEQMAKRAVVMRAKSEGNILRAYFLNEVVPAIEQEFDNRLASGQELVLELPDIDEVAREYCSKYFSHNRQLTK